MYLGRCNRLVVVVAVEEQKEVLGVKVVVVVTVAILVEVEGNRGDKDIPDYTLFAKEGHWNQIRFPTSNESKIDRN